MSWNHENIAWQSKDKTWNIGFFPSSFYGNEADGDDPEWDVEYDYNSFDSVFTGYKTVEEAQKAAGRNYGNFGGSQIMGWNKENAEEIAKYDQMALWHTNPELAKAAAKKEVAKLKREHAKKLKEAFAANDDYKGLNVTVIVKVDDNTHTRLGMSKSYSGYARTEGEWLVVEGVKVKNMVTGRLNRKLHEVLIQRVPSYGYGWR